MIGCLSLLQQPRAVAVQYGPCSCGLPVQVGCKRQRGSGQGNACMLKYLASTAICCEQCHVSLANSIQHSKDVSHRAVEA
eukprot:349801-Chlamydomonas_euryale.AAC.53